MRVIAAGLGLSFLLSAPAVPLQAQRAETTDLTEPAPQTKIGQRLGRRLNDHLGRPSRSLVTRLPVSRSSQLQALSLQEDVARRR